MGNRLFVGNLAFDTTELELQDLFAAQGGVTEVKIVMDRDTGRSRGFAFVSMNSDADARAAIERLNGTTLHGRALRVDEAEERGSRAGGGGGGGRGFGGGGGGGGGRGGRNGGGRW